MIDMNTSTKNKMLWILAILAVFGAGAAYLYKENVREKYERITEEYEARPEMPVELSYRSALMGPGLVIVMKNTSARHLSVVATFLNPTLNKEESYRIDISPSSVKEVGHAEGWAFSSSDVIKLIHNEYKTKILKLP